MYEFTPAELCNAVGRARQILSDPESVVIDPFHYTELSEDGSEHFLTLKEVTQKHANCRVCFMGACGLAALEQVAFDPKLKIDFSDPDNYSDAEDRATELQETVEELLTRKARVLGVPIDPEAERRWGAGDDQDELLRNSPVVMTSALIAGRAVEVCDAVIADLCPE